MLDTGDRIPDLPLALSSDKSATLGDYAGRWLVLYFYPKDDTPGCTKEACGFRDLNADLAKAGVVVLGVSRDSAESHRRFQAKYTLPFPLLSDPDTSVHKAYGAWGKKLMYGKPVEGVIRSTVLIGPDGVVRKHWPAVRKTDEHPAEVLAFLGAPPSQRA